MVYIIIDPTDGFMHMVTTNKAQAEREFAEVSQDDPKLVLRMCVDEGRR